MTACRLHALSLKVVPLVETILTTSSYGEIVLTQSSLCGAVLLRVSTRLAEKQPLGSVLLQLNCFALLLFLKGKSTPGTHNVLSHRLSRFVRLARSNRSIYSPV
jgi:hypothetical protein